ncbi:MAG: M20 family metallo-hydrolase [Ilumatobacteraceae bacterium]|nr:M20 family metallo-hydrolase [Actinomycetota bacterium]MDA2983016.1 M20 family metallo-hydrolase [Actinomycetota bacterium]MDA3041665.1 M20 family metallo-hydrolase [Actinomycetota bacterium]MDP4736327.1 M20 family metallo-hydrolase [Ilumatobacteraceae bacterium]MDP4981017.1 M20 family metallo-hydrolase [Ilumatobacteraceae bacterium]
MPLGDFRNNHLGLKINWRRLEDRINALAEISPIDGGGNCRLALTDEDKDGRDLVVSWMRSLDLEVTIDVVGNIIGVWNVGSGAPVMSGSHIDTVRTGGRFDGCYGVLAALEVIESCKDANISPPRPLAVGIFTDEEGSRFAPDMLGSLVYVGGMPVEQALNVVAIDGARLGDELMRIGYSGPAPCPGVVPHAFVELHIEQGPMLEANDVRIGAVTSVQGISWQEVTVIGQSNHAGTTPMSLRHDPAYVAAEITVFLRKLASEFGGDQVCTVGKIDIHPNLTNVVPAKATLTLDVRNTDESLLKQAESRIAVFLTEIAAKEGVKITSRQLARFEPVIFDDEVINIVESIAKQQGNTVQRMPSGAGHDAQMLARICPSGMIFVPSVKGISHNPAEFTESIDLEAGANILLHTMLSLTTLDKSTT